MYCTLTKHQNEFFGSLVLEILKMCALLNIISLGLPFDRTERIAWDKKVIYIVGFQEHLRGKPVKNTTVVAEYCSKYLTRFTIPAIILIKGGTRR